MEIAYCFSALPYIVSRAFIKENEGKEGSFEAESDQKSSLAMLGFALGKCISLYVYGKMPAKSERRLATNLATLISCCVLFLHTLMASLSKVSLIINYYIRINTALFGSFLLYCGVFKMLSLNQEKKLLTKTWI